MRVLRFSSLTPLTQEGSCQIQYHCLPWRPRAKIQSTALEKSCRACWTPLSDGAGLHPIPGAATFPDVDRGGGVSADIACYNSGRRHGPLLWQLAGNGPRSENPSCCLIPPRGCRVVRQPYAGFLSTMLFETKSSGCLGVSSSRTSISRAPACAISANSSGCGKQCISMSDGCGDRSVAPRSNR